MKYPFFLILVMHAAPLLSEEIKGKCKSSPSAFCAKDPCSTTFCLGPENYGANAPVHPFTCNGDWDVTLAGLYWVAYQDGMEYAIQTQSIGTNEEKSTLVNAQYKNPHFDWNFGFKFGLGYNTTCDGWDIGALWTHYHGKASSHNQAEPDDNTTLLPLWSDYAQNNPGDVLTASDIETYWILKLNLADLDLGRMYWNSRRLSLRPHIGIRIAFIDQNFKIDHKGGSWNDIANNRVFTNEVDLDNDFKGGGLRLGIDTLWNVGCGFSLYGDCAFSLISGHFQIEHDETNREVTAPFSKNKVMEIKDSFHNNILIVDLGIGIHYQTFLCDCNYALGVSLGWEQHIFLSQNQMWRIMIQQGSSSNDLNNLYAQSRGDLSTQGWTFTVCWDF